MNVKALTSFLKSIELDLDKCIEENGILEIDFGKSIYKYSHGNRPTEVISNHDRLSELLKKYSNFVNDEYDVGTSVLYDDVFDCYSLECSNCIFKEKLCGKCLFGFQINKDGSTNGKILEVLEKWNENENE